MKSYFTNEISHNHAELEVLFNNTFSQQYNTVLLGGANEPLYEPVNKNSSINKIFYRLDYFSSALHEVSHWCIAGEIRRQQIDYGYWYSPDGRNAQQQSAFEKVEIKPQAIEWAFSLACKLDFRVSVDNLNALEEINDEALVQQEKAFIQAVKEQLLNYIAHGFPKRASCFLEQLHAFYGTPNIDKLIQ